MPEDSVVVNVAVPERTGAKLCLDAPTGQLNLVSLEVFFGTHAEEAATVTPLGSWPDDYDTKPRTISSTALQAQNVVVQVVVFAKQPAAVAGQVVIAGTLAFDNVAPKRAVHTIVLRAGDRAAPGFLAWTVRP